MTLRHRILAAMPSVASGETITAAELVERLNASRDAVYQQLSRMARAGDVERLAMGVYVMREVSR